MVCPKLKPGNCLHKTNCPNGKVSICWIFFRPSQGKSIPEVIFEYYDAGNKLYYSITLTNAYLTQLGWLTPECLNCLKLELQAGFVFKTYKTFDAATGMKVTWDIPAGTLQ
ncbi:MAG: hypothetical protein ACXWWA_14660 [Chitinophagaceae bacterium]